MKGAKAAHGSKTCPLALRVEQGAHPVACVYSTTPSGERGARSLSPSSRTAIGGPYRLRAAFGQRFRADSAVRVGFTSRTS